MNRFLLLFFFFCSFSVCAQVTKVSNANVKRYKIKSEIQKEDRYENGKLTANYDTMALTTFNKDGNILKVLYYGRTDLENVYDEKGRVIKCVFDYDSIFCKYDEQGNEIETKTYPIYPPSASYSRTTRKFDENGVLLEEMEFNDDTGSYLKSLRSSMRYFPKEKRRELFSRELNTITITYYNEKDQVVEIKSGNKGSYMQFGIGNEIWNFKENEISDTLTANYKFSYGGETVYAHLYTSYIAEYNENGFLKEMRSYDSRDSLTGISKYNENGKLVETFFSVGKNKGKNEMKYDASGNKISEIHFYNGKLGTEKTFVYWENDSIKEEERKLWDSNSGNLRNHDIIKYDNKGRLVQRTGWAGDTVIIDKVYNTYNKKDQLISKYEYHYNGGMTIDYKTELKYSRNGLLARQTNYSKGKLDRKIKYGYTYY
jgi:hypothetical protein